MQLRELVIATGNRGNLAELGALLADSGIEVRSQADFAVPEVAETGLSFVENAIIWHQGPIGSAWNKNHLGCDGVQRSSDR